MSREVCSHLVLPALRSQDRRMGSALFVLAVSAGVLGVAKARRYPFDSRRLSVKAPPSPPLPRWVLIEYRWMLTPRKLMR
jgi:hypothetical protein